MSGMYGGHAGGKISTFWRCIFLKGIGRPTIAKCLVTAICSRPTPLCYLHLLHGGSAVSDIDSQATTFGCRDWDSACVITGAWPRDQGDDSKVARFVRNWVYDVAEELLPLSCGAYAADLGRDARDAMLATKAFGPNLQRLARLRALWDPNNVLAHACPLPKVTAPKLIVLVTGGSCAGKDDCADIWARFLESYAYSARAVSISDATKREYAAASGGAYDLLRLLEDRTYKETHRTALTHFFQNQVKNRPYMHVEHFMEVVREGVGFDVLFITGMRYEAPVARFSHRVAERRFIEVYVHARADTRRVRRDMGSEEDGETDHSSLDMPDLKHSPTFMFNNDLAGEEPVEDFAESRILPFLHSDMGKLASMVQCMPNFPRAGSEFRHIVGNIQQTAGLALCTILLQTHFSGDWTRVGALVCCEVSAIAFASALALQVDKPLIRGAGRLPPPTVSVIKSSSYVSEVASDNANGKRIELELSAVPKGAGVVVIDDVLSTGKTLCAVILLLVKAGVALEKISVMVVAGFPLHRGRELLRERGFGGIEVKSLLVLDGE